MKTIVTLAAALVLLMAAPSGAATAPDVHVPDIPADPAARAIALAKDASAMQTRLLGGDVGSAPAPAEHATPSEAVHALLARHAVTPDARTAADVRALDALPAPTRSALTDVVNTFVAMEDATVIAFAHADVDALANAAMGDGVARDVRGMGLDLAPVVASRLAFLDAALAFHAAVRDHGVGAGVIKIQVAPVFAIDLIGEDTTYRTDFLLLVDAAGDDTYWNNAGGSAVGAGCFSIAQRAAALLDVAGRDAYSRGDDCGANGGGSFGTGTLIDLGTERDVYTAGRSGTNGGGSAGSGFLLDDGGNNVFTAGAYGTNGGGSAGAGMLVSGTGNDVYTAEALGANGGGNLGHGILIDSGGNDRYRASSPFASNGGVGVGTGLLFDADGTDYYSMNSGGTWAKDATVVPKGGIGGTVPGAGAQIDSDHNAAVPSVEMEGGPRVGPDGDGDGLPGHVYNERCWLHVDSMTTGCPFGGPPRIAIDPDDSDVKNPAGVPRASGGARAGCTQDDVCATVEVDGGAAGEGVAVEPSVSAAPGTGAIGDATGARPVRVGPEGATVQRPTGVAVETDATETGPALLTVSVGRARVAYEDDDPATLTAPSVDVSGVTTLSVEVGDVHEPMPAPALRRAVTTLAPGVQTHELPSVRV